MAAEAQEYGKMMLFLQSGGSPDGRDVHGKTALYYLAKYGEVGG
tara:strand:- start:71 stop:202 length:132 start_codon:yes stop_codon:yes gene_type:complete